jgi:hypothetical protein
MPEFRLYHDAAYWREVAARRKRLEAKLIAKGIVPNSSKWWG